jgi:hypothetical protein
VSSYVHFLRKEGFRTWPSSPDYWLIRDEESNHYGDTEERAEGVIMVIIHPGSDFLEILAGRERQLERSAQRRSWDENGRTQ